MYQTSGPNPAKGRSAVTNRTALLPGQTRGRASNRERRSNRRGTHARRFADLCTIYAEPLGGLAGLSEHDLVLVKTAAGLTVEGERLQAAMVDGEPVNHDALVRISSETRRVLERLEARAGAQQRPQSVQSVDDLQAYLAAKREDAA
jgi:hypothetical protein